MLLRYLNNLVLNHTGKFIVINVALAIPFSFLDRIVAPIFQIEGTRFYGKTVPFLWNLHIWGPKILFFIGIAIFIYLISASLYFLIKNGLNFKYDRLHKKLIAIIASLILGPGILVNLLLKMGMGRPRPFVTTDLGGPIPFYPPFWFNYEHFSCRENGCASFVSGDVSIAFWLFSFVFLLPIKARNLYSVFVLLFTALMGFARVSQGRHFLSDVYYAVFFNLLVIFFTYKWVFKKEFNQI